MFLLLAVFCECILLDRSKLTESFMHCCVVEFHGSEQEKHPEQASVALKICSFLNHALIQTGQRSPAALQPRAPTGVHGKTHNVEEAIRRTHHTSAYGCNVTQGQPWLSRGTLDVLAICIIGPYLSSDDH